MGYYITLKDEWHTNKEPTIFGKTGLNLRDQMGDGNRRKLLEPLYLKKQKIKQNKKYEKLYNKGKIDGQDLKEEMKIFGRVISI